MITKRVAPRLLVLLAVVFLSSVSPLRSAQAAVGDIVHTVQVPPEARANFSSVGIAFDGTSLYTGRDVDSNIFRFDPISGILQEIIPSPAAVGVGAMAFDASRNSIWYGTMGSETDPTDGQAGIPIRLLDLDTNSSTLQFFVKSTHINPVTGEACVSRRFLDGLALDLRAAEDPNDDRIYFSDDINRNICIFNMQGNLVGGLDATNADPSLSSLSGLAIGGPFLYMGNDGGGQVWRAGKETLFGAQEFAARDDRVEDMECDPNTFGPTEVMWVRTTPLGNPENDIVTAYEIEPGSCGLGGAPADTDADGLFDVWETQGIDLDGDGEIDVDLPAMGANPNKKDIFVEVDWMERGGLLGHSHMPKSEAIEKIVQAFADAPVDGGGGINLHVDVGPESTDFVTGNKWGSLSQGNVLPHDEVLGDASNENALTDDLNNLIANHFGHTSRVFHYALFVHRIAHPDFEDCTGGVAFRQVFVVALGGWPGCPLNPIGVGSVNEQAGTFMHELGHSLGLLHGGNEDVDPSDPTTEIFNYKPNYLSVMSYSFQTSGLVINEEDGNFDYSRFELPTLEEANLNEDLGIAGGPVVNDYGTKNFCGPGSIRGFLFPGFKLARNANGPLDWNCNIVTGGVHQVDVNNAGGDDQLLSGFNDWENLDYEAGNIGRAGTVSPLAFSVEDVDAAAIEITEQEDQQIQRIGEPRVLLAKAVSPEIVAGGATVIYTITMTNNDAADVVGITITDTLPAGFIYQTGSTSGATIDEPEIDGQSLIWRTFAVPADGDTLVLRFSATAASALGTYLNSVSGTSTNGLVVPTGETASVEVRMQHVEIDIWPFLERNIIFLKKGHPVPVAILSNTEFDAANEVHTASLTFGRTGDEDSLKRCLRHAFDANKDGLADLICVFRSSPAGFQEGDAEGILKGMTVDGIAIEGRDSVIVLPAKETRLFRARLRGENELPPVETDASGVSILRLKKGEAELSFLISVQKLAEITAIHIHCAPEGQNGPVAVTLFEGEPVNRRVFKGIVTAPDDGNECGWEDLDAVAIAIRSGDTYINVHTEQHPAGEIRGQIEAVALHDLDNLDSRVNQIKLLKEEARASREAWTAYDGMLRRLLYVGRSRNALVL